jgi:hypothetical protein
MGNVSSDHFLIENPSIGDYQQFEDSLHCGESLTLGYSYKVWKSACIYKFVQSGTMGHSAEAISNFIEIEQEVISGFITGNEWATLPMFILKAVGHDTIMHSRYVKHIIAVRDDPLISDDFKNKIVLHLMPV